MMCSIVYIGIDICIQLITTREEFKISYEDNKPDILWMEQIEPVFGTIFEPAAVAVAINIPEGFIEERYPVQEVSTGLPFIIVPLKDLAAVKACRIDRVGYFQLIDQAEAKSSLVFSPETYSEENDLNARMFDDFHGITEDPAAGSANGCLAAYSASATRSPTSLVL